jgi:glycosyltransferase involved in cell wall biosynthesis
MRILYIAQVFASPEDPGALRHHSHVETLVRRGHEVVVLSSSRVQGGGRELTDATKPRTTTDTLEIVRIGTPTLRRGLTGRLVSYLGFMGASFLRGLRLGGRFDVVFVSSPPLFVGLTGVVLAWLRHSRFVLEVRDLWPESAIVLGFLKNPVLIWLSRRFEGWLYGRARRIICVTDGIANRIRSRVQPPGKVHLVRNGVDSQLFDVADTFDCERVRGDQPSNLVALYAGAHGVNNAVDVLIDAAQELRHDPVRILLLGSGSETESLRDRCKKLDLRNVVFCGSLPRKSVPAWELCADVLLWPVYLKTNKGNLWELKRGAVPNKLYDYLAAGRPVVTSIPQDGEGASLLKEYGIPFFVPPTPSGFAKCLRELTLNRGSLPTANKKALAFRETYGRQAQATYLAEILEAMDSPTCRERDP